VSLAQGGQKVDVAFEMPYRCDASVWGMNSDSRAMDPKLAARKITSLMSHLPLANNPPLVMKKIDSTLRGNIGAESE
ncbi:four-carbon acid sugar kinase family protein, partial [Escherichia coli]